jgi:hypothetical protein
MTSLSTRSRRPFPDDAARRGGRLRACRQKGPGCPSPTGLTTRRLTLRKIFPSAIGCWISEKVKFGQSTLGHCRRAADASGGIAATIDDGSTAQSLKQLRNRRSSNLRTSATGYGTLGRGQPQGVFPGAPSVWASRRRCRYRKVHPEFDRGLRSGLAEQVSIESKDPVSAENDPHQNKRHRLSRAWRRQ